MKNSKDDGIKELLDEMKRKFDVTENQQISLASQNKQDAEKFKHLKKRSKQQPTINMGEKRGPDEIS